MAIEQAKARADLHPDLPEAIARVMSGAGQSDPVGLLALLEHHDPRFVAGLTVGIRHVVDEALFQRRIWWSLRTQEKAARFVAGVVAIDPAAAFPLSVSGNGFIRQTAIEAIEDAPGAFCLALLVHRMNDWVPNVCRAAMAKLEALLGRIPPESVVEAAEFLWAFERVERAEDKARELVSNLLAKSEVRAGIKRRILQGSDNKSYRLLKLALRRSGLDDVLPYLVRNHQHQAARNLAARVVFEGRYAWLDAGRHKSRAIACANCELLAQELLADTAVRVKFHALSYLAYHLKDEAALESILLRFVAHPRLSLARLAQWRLSKLEIDWLSWLRERFNRQRPDPNIARVLGYAGSSADGDLLYSVAKVRAPLEAFPFLAASAQLKNKEAISRLQDLALRGPDIDLAKRSARALIAADEGISFAALKPLADAGEDFLRRGLRPHLNRCDVLSQLNLLCRLERSGAYIADDEDFRRLRRRINRGRFQPRMDEERALAEILGHCPVIRARSRNQLMIAQGSNDG